MKTLLTAVATLVANIASAQVAVVSHPINLEAEKAAAITAVCAQAYHEVSNQNVFTVADAESAKAQGAAEIVELNFIGLDGARTRKILVNGVRKTMQGEVVHSASIDALSMEDAPTVCGRLATALVRKQTIEETQTRTTVTEAEAQKRSKRLASTHSLGVKTGVTVPFSPGVAMAPMGSIGFDARFENERWFYELGVGLLIPVGTANAQGYGGVSADLGASYFLTDTDFAPYVGLGLQPRLAISSSPFNLVPYAQLGATLSRKNTMRLYAEARVGQNVLPISSAVNTPGTHPTEFTFNVGLGF